jgi:RNA polymerase sigma-70 factor (ECF subfamily)
MKRKDGPPTSSDLLKRAANWEDRAAWSVFFKTYDPLIHLWCRGYNLDDATHRDLCQQIWLELAKRIRTYQYDPGKTFRGWLRQFCHSRALDLLRKRKAEPVCFLDHLAIEARSPAVAAIGGEDGGELDSRCSRLLHQAELAQEAVKVRVDARSWQVFWRIGVEGRSLRDTADEVGMSYAAVFAAHKRVARMLRAEGERHISQRSHRELVSVASERT